MPERCDICRGDMEYLASTRKINLLYWIYQKEPFLDKYRAKVNSDYTWKCPNCQVERIEQRTYEVYIHEDDEFCLN